MDERTLQFSWLWLKNDVKIKREKQADRQGEEGRETWTLVK